jgi:hypothetical protein
MIPRLKKFIGRRAYGLFMAMPYRPYILRAATNGILHRFMAWDDTNRV